MKKIFLLTFALLLSAEFLYSGTSEAHKKFIRGNLSEKTSAVRESSGTDNGHLAQIALDFVLLNKPLLDNERELAPLAVAAILALPKDGFSSQELNDGSAQKLMKIFEQFSDDNVKITILDKIPSFNVNNNSGVIKTINDYLRKSSESGNNFSLKAAINCAGKIGNSESFEILYEGWNLNKWPDAKEETQENLVLLSQNNVAEVVKVISRSKIDDNYRFLSLLKEKSKNNQIFISEIAENSLSQAIHNREIKNEFSSDEINYQLMSLKILSDNKWSRASSLIVKFFSIARLEFESNVLSAEQLIQVIDCTAGSGSIEAAHALSDYLAYMNRNVEQNKMPPKNVVLAVINNLGALGDKTSFDNLLYVTYLSYPEEVITASRDALSKLRW